MPRTKKAAQRKSSRPRLASRRAVFDRAQFTVEHPNFLAGRADLHRADDESTWLTGHAPERFDLTLNLDRGDVWLWIGIHAPDGEDAARRCFAVLGGETLLQLAADVVRYSKPRAKGGAK